MQAVEGCECSHGICHVHMDIVNVKVYLPGVRYSFECTLCSTHFYFEVFLLVLLGPMKQKLSNIGICICVKQYIRITNAYDMFFSWQRNMYFMPYFEVKLFPEQCVCVNFVPNSMSALMFIKQRHMILCKCEIMKWNGSTLNVQLHRFISLFTGWVYIDQKNV